MSILNNVTKGKVNQSLLMLVHGVDGVGKSSLAASAPSPIFLGPESGTNFLDVARLPQPETFDDVIKAIEALTNETHEYKTLAIDSLDWIEPLVWTQVCAEAKVDQIEDLGYGKGYVNALSLWDKMIKALSVLRSKRNMHIIMIAHSLLKTHNDPVTNSSYERYILKLNEKAGSKLREFVDFVFFANFEVTTSKDGKTKRIKAFSDGTRYLYTERRAAFDAKSRLAVPFEIPLTWEDLTKALNTQKEETPEIIKASISGLMASLKDAELITKVKASIEKAGTNLNTLRNIRSRLNDVVNNAA